MKLKQSPIVNSIFYYYPKVFSINELYQNWSQNQENFIIGSEIDGKVVLPDSLPAINFILKDDSILLVDNGFEIFVYL